MITLKKILSALLISVLLIAVTGVSFSKHICLSGKSAACAKSKNCCKGKHAPAAETKCCTVQDFYFKANIISTHDHVKQKFSSENFIAVLVNHFFVSPSQTQFAESGTLHKPPLLRSCRSILLDSSRLTI